MIFTDISSVQSLSHVRLFAIPWITARQASLSITNSRSLFKLMSIASVMPSNHLILCHTLLLLPSIFPSIRVFSSELVLCIRWPKYWSFSFSISPSNEYSGLISFRMGWLYLLAIQGTPKSLLQHHSSKASILWCFFIYFSLTFSLSSFTYIKRLFNSSLSAIRVVSSAYLRLLIFLPAILIPACASSSPASLMMYSAYKLNKQGDNIQPWRTPFPIWNQSVVPCPVLTCFLTCIQISQEAAQVIWYSLLFKNFI